MGDLSKFDAEHNTTSIPSTGIFVITAGQFFCSVVKEADVRCISSAQFAGLPLRELCPSGDCWTDCQDLSRLYAPLPSGITFANETFYGTAPTVTFWNLCNGLANITEAVSIGIPPEDDVIRIQPFLKNSTETNLRAVASATTTCWSDTCSQARRNNDCMAKCAAVNLLESRTIPQLAGTRECIRSVCLNIDGLPFANQDVVGIGVSISYVIQSFLVILIWATLTFATLNLRKKRSVPVGSAPISTAWTSLLESISGFHAAQCFFSIPLAIAVFFTDPFKLDPLNAFGLLPVALNGILPITFTLMILHHFRHSLEQPLSWYAILLTDVSYMLNTVVLFAVVSYLAPIKTRGVALQESAFQALGNIGSCGGSTAIAVCLATQADSPPAFLLQQFPNLAFAGVRLAPVAWAICTICLGTINYRQLKRTDLGHRFGLSFLRRNSRETNISPRHDFARFLRFLPGATLYYVASIAILLSLIFQATMFYTYLALDLIDLGTWSLGQIVAISVWIPPVIDYLHLQSVAKYGNLATPREAQDKFRDGREALTPGLTPYTPSLITQDTNDPGNDEDDAALLTHPNSFRLEQRSDRGWSNI